MERRAFEALLREHQGAVRAFLRRLLPHARADELAQEVFLKAWQVDFRRVENPRSFLYRMAYRRFLDDRRRDTRREELSAGAPTPDTAARPAHGARLDIARAVDALPPERRACALLCLALGHSHADAAAITGLPLGTVKSHVARARASLQDSLRAYRMMETTDE